MTLEYKSSFDLKTIMPVLDEHLVWHGKIIRGFFAGEPLLEPFPKAFTRWLEEAEANKTIHPSTSEKLKRIHKEMVTAANEFVIKSSFNGVLPLVEYNELNRNYEEFIMAMRRIERDHALENSGFDEKTGLRSFAMMEDDVSIELQRRARQGNPFCLALLRINNFEDSWRHDVEEYLPIVQKTSLKIRECLRGFDDAYYIGDEHFLLSLKHADMIGAEIAISRINFAIAAAHIPMPNDPLTDLTVSAVVYEPEPSDDLNNLIKNMKNDLMMVDKRKTIIKFNDVSPMQRHVMSMAKQSENSN